MKVTTEMIEVPPAEINVSSPAFHWWAKQYYYCVEDFRPFKFSPVPFVLLCEAIELELKSRLMKDLPPGPKQPAMKEDYRRDLEEAYNDLKSSEQVLTSEQLEVLRKINAIYKKKGFTTSSLQTLHHANSQGWS
jgi:hypothetical protein